MIVPPLMFIPNLLLAAADPVEYALQPVCINTNTTANINLLVAAAAARLPADPRIVKL